jgi:hypothetical protein
MARMIGRKKSWSLHGMGGSAGQGAGHPRYKWQSLPLEFYLFTYMFHIFTPLFVSECRCKYITYVQT